MKVVFRWQKKIMLLTVKKTYTKYLRCTFDESRKSNAKFRIWKRGIKWAKNT